MLRLQPRCTLRQRRRNKGGNRIQRFPPFCQDLLLLKDILAHAAHGALPALRHILPGSAGGDAVLGVADSGVIDVAAGAHILVRVYTPYDR